MTDHEDSKLRDAIMEVVAKIRRFQDRTLGEQNTKASLIEPILEALGWDIHDPDEVHREYKPTPKDCPVDYALKLLRDPKLLLEAKGLREDLSDRRWVSQVLGYTTVAGVEWCVLSDGDEYRFYNATAPVDAEDKLLCRIRLSECAIEVAVETLKLMSHRNLGGDILAERWKAHFVDRHVKSWLGELFAGPDKGLVRLLRRKSPKLKPTEIVESLRRLDLHFGAVTSPPVPMHPQPTRRKGTTKPTATRSRECKLSEIIAAGLLSPPVKLFRKYKGKVVEATVMDDGTVEFQGTSCKTSSRAAEAALISVTGRAVNINGWKFWQYVDKDGTTHTLNHARQKHLSLKTAGS